MKVILLAGQSNLAGRAPGEEAGVIGEESAIRMDCVCSFARDVATPHRSQGWVPLGVSPAHEGIVGPHFGPEIGFGRGLVGHRIPEQIALIKHGRGATNLAEDWHPEATTGKMLYQDFLGQIRAALARLKSEAETLSIEALIWCQGEADATRSDWAALYETNLRRLLERVRSDLDCSDLKLIVAQTGGGRSDAGMTHAKQVRLAQSKVVDQDPQSAMVLTDDLTLLDHVHYDAPSQLRLGYRFAAAYLAMCHTS